MSEKLPPEGTSINALFPGIFIGCIFDEQEDEHVIFLLGCIHTSPEFIATLPERAIEF